MNIPITKSEVVAFKNSSDRFISTNVFPNRKERRDNKKHRRKNRFVIYTNPETGVQSRSIERWQLVTNQGKVVNKIQHFTE